MTAIKERILGAVSIMNDDAARNVWNYILENFSVHSWEDVEEVAPDASDIEMLRAASEDSDCQEFISSDAAMKEIGL